MTLSNRLLIACVLLGLANPAPAEDLLDIYQRALQSDPLIREAEATRLASSEALPQARGALLPQINGSASEQRSDSEGNSVFIGIVNGIPEPQETRFRVRDNETFSWDITLRQSLFRWDQIVGLRQAKQRVAEADATYEAAQQSLLLRVAERYFGVLAAQDTLEANEASRLAISKQLDQAQKRFEVGLIAITDVQESQAAFDQAIADEIQAKRALATARYQLSEITNAPVGGLAKPDGEFPLSPPSPEIEDEWVAVAMEQNLDLIAGRIAAEIASKDVGIQRSGHMPTVDLVARRDHFEAEEEQSNGDLPFLPLGRSNDGTSVSIQVSIPIFSGGATSSRVRQAVYNHRAARERVQRIARETERLTRDAYLGVLTDISRTKALQQALKSSETALEATQAGFDVGTRTTVDVLDAQRALFNARTQYLSARYDYLLNVLRLKQAAGGLQVQDLEQINRLLAE
ncbi:MAG: TolC family outer membrane protein [Pseudomonadota bacterium]